MPKISPKLDSLQLVRAIAMLLVLLIHADFFSTKIMNTPFLFGIFSPGGDAGVDIFFVLSGFIIFYVHNRDINQKSKFFPYLFKRFSRIYPVYWLVTLIVILLYLVFPRFATGGELETGRIINSFLLLPSTQAPIIHAAWTLVNEVLFYLSFSLLILFGLKKMFPFIVVIFLLTTFGWFYSLENITSFQNSLLYVFFSYHNFEFLLGALGAGLLLNGKVKFNTTVLVLGIILLSIMILFEYLNEEPFYPLRIFGFGLPAFMVITSLAALEYRNNYKTPNNFIYQTLLFLGNASFSIYLTHQVLISGIGRTLFALKIFTPNFIILLTILLTLLLGSLFYLLIEKPLLLSSRGFLLSKAK